MICAHILFRKETFSKENLQPHNRISRPRYYHFAFFLSRTFTYTGKIYIIHRATSVTVVNTILIITSIRERQRDWHSSTKITFELYRYVPHVSLREDSLRLHRVLFRGRGSLLRRQRGLPGRSETNDNVGDIVLKSGAT